MGLQFVFIHGSYHNGGHWDKVIEGLVQEGHRGYGPTLLGNEPEAQEINHTMSEVMEKLEDDILSQNLSDFILVAHSTGGAYAQQIAQLSPKRVKMIIFISSIVVLDGENILKSVSSAVSDVQDQSASSNYGLPIHPPLDWWRTSFTNSVDSDTATQLYQTLVPQGGRSMSDTLDLTSFYELETPMSYISITSDLVFGDPKNGKSWHPTFTSRLGPNYKLLEMAGDHEVMLTAPLRLIHKLIEASTI